MRIQVSDTILLTDDSGYGLGGGPLLEMNGRRYGPADLVERIGVPASWVVTSWLETRHPSPQERDVAVAFLSKRRGTAASTPEAASVS